MKKSNEKEIADGNLSSDDSFLDMMEPDSQESLLEDIWDTDKEIVYLKDKKGKLNVTVGELMETSPKKSKK